MHTHTYPPTHPPTHTHTHTHRGYLSTSLGMFSDSTSDVLAHNLSTWQVLCQWTARPQHTLPLPPPPTHTHTNTHPYPHYTPPPHTHTQTHTHTTTTCPHYTSPHTHIITLACTHRNERREHSILDLAGLISGEQSVAHFLQREVRVVTRVKKWVGLVAT